MELAFTRGQTAHGAVTGVVGGSVVGVSKGQFPSNGSGNNPTMYATVDHPHRQQHMAHSPNCPLKVSKALSGSKKGLSHPCMRGGAGLDLSRRDLLVGLVHLRERNIADRGWDSLVVFYMLFLEVSELHGHFGVGKKGGNVHEVAFRTTHKIVSPHASHCN